MASAEPQADAHLASRIPLPREGVEALARRGAGAPWCLRASDGTGFAEVDEEELALWRLLDGRRSVGELALHGLTRDRPADWLGSTLSKFAAGHLLAGDWPGAGRGQSRLLLRFGGPWSLSGAEWLARGLGTLLFAGFGCVGLVAVLLRLGSGEPVSLMPFGASPWSLLGWAVLASTVAEISRGLAYLSLSRPLTAIGLGLSRGLPVLTFDLPVLSPAEHARPAAVVESLRGWLDGFATLEELAQRPCTAGWQM